MNFIPDPIAQSEARLPWFEDSSREKGIAGHGTGKSIEDLQSEIRTAVGRLGGGVQEFTPGKFPGSPARYGYRVTFVLGSARGRFDVAALPIRQETPSKKASALKQALFMCREILEAQYYATLLMPGTIPLVPYLLGPGGKTVTEALVESGQLPALPGGEATEVVVGEVVE